MRKYIPLIGIEKCIWQIIIICSVSILFIVGFVGYEKFIDPYDSPKELVFLFSIGCLVFIISLRSIFGRRVFIYRISLIDISWIVLISYLLLRIAFTSNINLFENCVLLLVGYTILYMVLRRNIQFYSDQKRNNLWQIVCFAILSSALIQVIVGYCQQFGILDNSVGYFRVTGSFGNPGPYAMYLSAVFPLCLGLSFNYIKCNNALRILALFTAISIVSILPLTGSRSSWTSIILVSVLFLIHRLKLAVKFRVIFNTAKNKIIAILILAAVLVISGYSLYNIKPDSTAGRIFIWRTCIEMVKDAPLFGHGYNSFMLVQKEYQADYFTQNPEDSKNAILADNVNYAFNEYLQILAETGIIGLILFLGIVTITIASYIKSKYLHAEKRNPIFIFLLGLISILSLALFSYPFHSLPVVCMLVFYFSSISTYSYTVLSVELKPTTIWPIAICIVFLSINLIVIQVNRWKGELVWKEAFDKIKAGDRQQALIEYDKIYPVMKYNPHFLFNYGAELSVVQEFEKSNQILSDAEKRISHTDLFVYQGINYEALGEPLKAIACFKKASLFVPHKIYPKYRLFVLYHNIGDLENANDVARRIVETDVKIENEISMNIKNDMEKYLSQRF